MYDLFLIHRMMWVFLLLSSRLISAFVSSAWVVVDLPTMFGCMYSTVLFVFDLVAKDRFSCNRMTSAF